MSDDLLFISMAKNGWRAVHDLQKPAVMDAGRDIVNNGFQSDPSRHMPMGHTPGQSR